MTVTGPISLLLVLAAAETEVEKRPPLDKISAKPDIDISELNKNVLRSIYFPHVI